MKKETRTETGTGFLLANLLVKTKLLIEAADSSTSIHHLLLTSKEGVTLGAYFHSNVLAGRTCLDYGSTGALDGGLLIVGMNVLFHACSPLSTLGVAHRHIKCIKYLTTAF